MAEILLPVEEQDEKLPPAPKKLKLGSQTPHLFPSKDGQSIWGYSAVGIKSWGLRTGGSELSPTCANHLLLTDSSTPRVALS